jgi:hypothetical protein
MQFVFDIPHIVKQWPEFQRKLGCPSLPVEAVQADSIKLRCDTQLVQTVLQRAIFAASKVGLITTEISNQAVLLDLQKCINDKKLPTGGLTFDGDHASAIKRFNVFVCQEVSLAESLKTIARVVEEWSNGRHRPQIVSTARQLSQVVQNRHRILTGTE